MKTRIFFLVVLIMPLAAWGQTLSQRVPADALLYAGWQGTEALRGPYQSTHLKAVVDNTTIPEFIDKGIPALVDRLVASDPEAGTKLRIVLNLAAFAVKHPTAVYVGALEIKPEQPPMPRVAFVCDAGPDADALEKLLTSILAQAGPTPVPMAVKRNAGTVALVIGNLGDAAEALLLGRAAAGTPTLAADALFQSSLSQVQKNAAVTLYVNVPELLKAGDTIAALAGPAADMWPRVRDTLNLGGLRGAMLTAGFDGRDWLEQGYIGVAGERTGLLAMLNAAPLTEDQLRLIPAGATWLCAGRFDLEKLWDNSLTAVDKTAPQAKQQLETGVALADAMLGFDISKDFVAALGDKWTIYSAPNVGGGGAFGFTLINQLAEPSKFQSSLSRIETLANQALALNQSRNDPQIRILHSTIQDIDVHYMNFVIANPAWAIHDGKLYFTLMPQSIPAAVDAGNGANSILQNEAFLATRKRLGVENPGWLEFFDLPRTAPAGYPLLTQLVGLIGLFGGADAPPSLIPPLHRLLPEITPAARASWTDEKGWHVKTITPLPGSILLSSQQVTAVAGPALMASILLPSLARARDLAGRTADAANLKEITKACIIYAVEHHDNMPEHLAQLVAANALSPQQLIRKGSGTTPAVLTPEQFASAREDWHTIEKLVDDHCDYVYLGKGTKDDMDARAILALDKPWLGINREGIQCAYNDGHVEWHPLMSLRDEFVATNQSREKLGVKRVDVDALLQGPDK